MVASTTRTPDAEERAHEHHHALTAIKQADWMNSLPAEQRLDLKAVMEINRDLLQKGYLSPMDLLKRIECPTSPILWLSIAHNCLAQLKDRRLLPEYFVSPTHRALLVPAGNTPMEYIDPGNLNLEILWFALRIYTFISPDRHDDICQPRLSTYGEASNRSGKGLTNLRGNMLEAILTECYKQLHATV